MTWYTYRMARKDRTVIVGQARAALVVAAMRRTFLTYKELGVAIGLDGIALRNEMRHVLDDLSVECNARGEPSLAALVVGQKSGAPGPGWADGTLTWIEETRAVFERWRPV